MLTGTILQSGKYTIIQEIGKGGFGITFKAIPDAESRLCPTFDANGFKPPTTVVEKKKDIPC